MPQLLFAGEPLLHDFNREASGFLERYQRLDDTILSGEFLFKSTWQGNPLGDTHIGLPIVNWPKPPPLRLNQLYWPCTGASRWAEGLFLCTGKLVHTLQTCDVLDGGADLLYETNVSPAVNSLLAEKDDTPRKLEVLMYPIGFRRISGCHYKSNDPLDPNGVLHGDNDDEYDLYLLHLADVRYWWQFMDVPDVCEHLQSWDELIDHILDGLLIDAPWHESDIPLPAIYSLCGPHPSELTRHNYNAALMLDAVLESIGTRLVAKPIVSTNTSGMGNQNEFELQRCAGAEATFNDNITESLKDQLAGSWCNSFPMQPMPETVRVAFPSSRFGMLCGQCNSGGSPGGDGTTEDNCHQSYYTIDHTMSEYEDSGGSSGVSSDGDCSLHGETCAVQLTTKTIHVRGWADLGKCEDAYPLNNYELEALADQIARDWYSYHCRQYDFTVVGPTNWDPCGYDDCIIHKFGVEEDEDLKAFAHSETKQTGEVDTTVILQQERRRDCTSRIQSLPLNAGADCQLHNTNALELPDHLICKTPAGGIAGPSGYTIYGELCTAYRVVGDLSCGTLTREKVTAIDSAHSGNDYMVMVYQPICGDVAEKVYIDTAPFQCCARRVVVECCPTDDGET